MDQKDADEFTYAYIDALVLTSAGPAPEDVTLSPELWKRCEADCKSFLYRFEHFIRCEPSDPGMEQAGHDFALTRNRHGAGFWDGDWPVYGELLTKGAHSYGEIDLYVGDDGKLYA